MPVHADIPVNNPNYYCTNKPITQQALYQYAYKPKLTKHRTNTPINQPYNKTPCQSAYGTDPALALYYYIHH